MPYGRNHGNRNYLVFDKIDQPVIFVNAPRPIARQFEFQSFGLAGACFGMQVQLVSNAFYLFNGGFVAGSFDL